MLSYFSRYSEVDGEDEKKRLYISMLHKPDTEGCSEFLGCMSFGVKHLLAKQKVKKLCTVFALFIHWESTNISLIRKGLTCFRVMSKIFVQDLVGGPQFPFYLF